MLDRLDVDVVGSIKSPLLIEKIAIFNIGTLLSLARAGGEQKDHHANLGYEHPVEHCALGETVGKRTSPKRERNERDQRNKTDHPQRGR